MSFEKSLEPIITNRQKKEFAALSDLKGRRNAGLFVAEGTKCVLELAVAFNARHVYARPEWIEQYGAAIKGCSPTPCPAGVLKEITRLSTTPPVVAFFELPEAPALPSAEYFNDNLVLALDCIQDPGNLGTIIRTADWFGVRTILCSTDTVDAFNPKVVQATMGALAHVNIVYCNLKEIFGSLTAVPVYGTFLNGDNIYSASLSTNGVIVMGNEGRGISPELESVISRRLLIPANSPQAVESLNVAIATAVTLSQFRSR